MKSDSMLTPRTAVVVRLQRPVGLEPARQRRYLGDPLAALKAFSAPCEPHHMFGSN
jgi:hypothetical protein